MNKVLIGLIFVLSTGVVSACSKKVVDGVLNVSNCDFPIYVQEQDLPYMWNLVGFDFLEIPRKARMEKIFGYVDVEFVINIDGKVENATVISSSIKRIFDREALNHVISRQYTPVDSNFSMSVKVIQRIHFR